MNCPGMRRKTRYYYSFGLLTPMMPDGKIRIKMVVSRICIEYMCQKNLENFRHSAYATVIDKHIKLVLVIAHKIISLTNGIFHLLIIFTIPITIKVQMHFY